MWRFLKTAILVSLLTFVPIQMASAWTLMWDASTGTVDGYLVEISDDNGATWSYIYGTDTPGLNLDDKCAFNRTYMFRVSAFNVAGVSEPTAPLTWTRPGYTPPADSPLPTVNTGPSPDVPANQIVVE